jgi:hypothetical protein
MHLMCRSAVFWLVGVALIGSTACSSRGGGSQSPGQIAALMNELDGEGTLDKDVGQLLKQQPVEWEKVSLLAKRYAELTAEVSRSHPPKGSIESWGKHASAFAANGRRLLDAAQVRDRNEAFEAWNDLHRACAKCHDGHR